MAVRVRDLLQSCRHVDAVSWVQATSAAFVVQGLATSSWFRDSASSFQLGIPYVPSPLSRRDLPRAWKKSPFKGLGSAADTVTQLPERAHNFVQRGPSDRLLPCRIFRRVRSRPGPEANSAMAFLRWLRPARVCSGKRKFFEPYFSWISFFVRHVVHRSC